MSLEGLTIAITGSRRASELAHLISSSGGTPYIAPTVGIGAVEGIEPQVEAFVRRIIAGEVDYAVFMTGPGVYLMMSTAEKLGLKSELVAALNRIRIVGRSHKPKRALNRHGVKVDLVAEDEEGGPTSEGIAWEMKKLDLQGKRVAVLWYGSYKPVLKRELEKVGAQVSEAMIYSYSLQLERSGAQVLEGLGYRYIPPDEKRALKLINDIVARKIDVITFTSPPSARNLFKVAMDHGLDESLRKRLSEEVLVVAVGPPTRKAIEENRVKVDVIPDMYKLGPMVKAIDDYCKQPSPPKPKLHPHKIEPTV